MTVAAHIDSSGRQPSYLAACMRTLAVKNTSDHFVIFCAKEFPGDAGFTSNCTIVIVSPPVKNSMLLHYWYSYKLPALLIKYNAAVFVTESGACSLRTATPQVMVIKDFLLHPKRYPFKHAYGNYPKRFFLKFAGKAMAIGVTQKNIGDELVKNYPLLSGKLTTLLHGLPSTFMPQSETQNEILRNKYSNGQGYFVCECSALTQDNMLALLKAFSIFKKRLKSGMQLLLLNKLDGMPVKDFRNYRYRDEVQIINTNNEMEEAALIAAAYAGIWLPAFFIPANWGLYCMQCGIPLLAAEQKGMEDIFKDAAIYTPADEKKIAHYLMLLYKDEVYRNVYIKKGALLSATYNWPDSSSRLSALF
jgi:hypothetical protein